VVKYSLADVPVKPFLAYLRQNGMMLFPVHLCLVLTNEYFKADLSLIYSASPMVLLLLAGILLYLSGWPELFGG
jgi:hypothetical protein